MNKLPLSLSIRLVLLAGLAVVSVGAAGQGAGGNDAMVLLLEQNRNLQSEVQALRALVEEQGYEIRRLQRESLDRYTDTDNRLRSLEQGLAGGTGVPVPALTGTGDAAAPGTAAPGLPTRSLPTPGGSGNQAAVSSSDLPSSDPFGSSTVAPGQATADLTPGNPLPSGAGIGAGPGVNGGAPVNAAGTAAASITTPSRPGVEPAVLTEQQLYQMAYDSAINSQFDRAVIEFDQYLSLYPQGRFTTNAHYWKGQSYLYLRRYQEAIAEYSIILNQYPNDAKVPDAMYGQAVAYEGMGDTQRARRLLQQITRSYPNTGVANLADTRLRSLN